MSNKKNYKLWHDLRIVAFVSVFIGLFVGLLAIFNIYGHSSKSLQGYLINTETTENLQLYYEHLQVFQYPGANTLTMTFGVDDGNTSTDILSQGWDGFEIGFTNFPDYLSYDSCIIRNDLTPSWYTFDEAGAPAEFNTSTPIITWVNPNNDGIYLKDGEFVTITFLIDETAIAEDFTEIGVVGRFFTTSVTTTTEPGNFIVAPESIAKLDGPDNLYTTSTIDIPFDLSWASGVSPTDEPIYGATLEFEHIPSFMTFNSLQRNGYLAQNWMDSSNFNREHPKISMFSSVPVTTAGTLFNLQMNILDFSTVSLPVEPIKVNVALLNEENDFIYTLPIMMNVLSAIPQNVQAEAADRVVTITWNTVPGANSYEVYNDTDGNIVTVTGDNSVIYTVPASKYGTTIDYKVRAKINGSWSDYSELASATITQPTVPVPQNVNATAGGISGKDVTVTWTAVSGADSYEVYEGSTLVDTPIGTTYNNTVTVAYGTTLVYKVKAKIGSNTSEFSDSASVTIIDPTVPVPQNVNATAGGTSGKDVIVTWTAVSGADSYEVYEGSTLVDTPTGTTYSNTVTVAYGTTLVYKVKAKIGSDTSAFSIPASVTIVDPTPTIPVPQNVSATAEGTSGKDIIVAWDAVAGVDSYNINLDGAFFVNVLAPDTTYTYTVNVPYGTTLVYKVRAKTADNQSELSAPASVTIADPNPTIPAPENVVATAVNRTVTITWDSVTGTDMLYDVFSITDGVMLGSSINTNTYTDVVSDSKYGTTVSYKVRARQGTILSNYSTPASVAIVIPYGNAGDICSFDDDGNIQSVGDYLASMPDLNCLITEWKDTGDTLIADIYDLTPSNQIVDIRDLTQLLSAWSDDPVISTILPSSGNVGDEVTLTGSSFYSMLPPSYIEVYLINKINPSVPVEATITQITDTEVKFTVPSAAAVGEYNIRIGIAKTLFDSASSFTVL